MDMAASAMRQLVPQGGGAIAADGGVRHLEGSPRIHRKESWAEAIFDDVRRRPLPGPPLALRAFLGSLGLLWLPWPTLASLGFSGPPLAPWASFGFPGPLKRYGRQSFVGGPIYASHRTNENLP